MNDKKHSKLYVLSLLLLSLWSNNNAIAQEANAAVDALKQFAKNAYTFQHLYPQEKVYLHFDNSSYYQDETIWFKAYVVRAADAKYSTDSKILYVELLSEEGEQVDRRKLKIENGQCNGEFVLDHKIKTGFYELRAYTRGMLNFGDECIYSHVFPVYERPLIDGDYSEKNIGNSFSHSPNNKRKKATQKAKKKRRSINLNFYPEGGHQIEGLPSKVAFKATGRDGQSLELTGKVIDANGEIVSMFSTAHQGMGTFECLTSQENKVEITYLGENHRFYLPKTRPTGYALRVDNLHRSILGIKVLKSSELPTESLGLSITCRNTMLLFNVLKVVNDKIQLTFDKSTLPTGVCSATLFRANGEILAERLFYIHHQNDDALQLTASNNIYRPLQKIDLSISAKDKENRPIQASLSVAVKDAASSGSSTYSEDIRSYLLLSSDLKGYIHQPGYYFAADDMQHRYALDLLMMTQGWRRYSWQQMSGITPLEIKHPIEETLMIKGQIIKAIKDTPMAEAPIKYRITKDGKETQVAMGISDENGEFAFLLNDTLDILDRWDLMLSVPRKGPKSNRNRILLDRQFGPEPKVFAYHEAKDRDTLPAFTTHDKEETEKRSIEEVQLIKEYKLIRHRSQLELPNMTFDVNREANLLADKGIYFASTVGGYLEDKLPEFRFQEFDSLGAYNYLGREVIFCHIYSRDIYSRHTQIADIGIEAVDKIEVHIDKHSWDYLSDNYSFRDLPIDRLSEPGSSTQYAVVIVFTKNDKSYKDVPKGMRLTFFEGYANSKEFAKEVLHKPIVGEIDHRRTLYWNPDVKLNKDGMAEIEFYNNSSCEHLLIEAQGITKGGTPVSISQQ